MHPNDDEGLLDLWIEWLREQYRQEYDKIQEVVRRAKHKYRNTI